jgi:hypothetical protein
LAVEAGALQAHEDLPVVVMVRNSGDRGGGADQRCSSALGAVPIVMLVEDVPLPLVTP